MSIRNFAAIAATVILSAAPALATVQGGNGPALVDERPATPYETVERRAGDVLQRKDLVRRHLDADDIITVSLVPSAGPVDFSSANGG
ncbi:hypothetical protein [Paracoccus sp. PARArs4]|uniref:hypothetical protein n=1 Tax=Paracoccus sp. PARArs4 TaxID=2853442 RepID=UPI0024A7418C|nr:hypothetical protein [Paracoccus sp. PARArs4]